MNISRPILDVTAEREGSLFPKKKETEEIRRKKRFQPLVQIAIRATKPAANCYNTDGPSSTKTFVISRVYCNNVSLCLGKRKGGLVPAK